MKYWYLLYCKRQEQARAKLHLENQGVECYYPDMLVEKIVRGKKELVTEALFPGYVFIQFDPDLGPSFTTIRSTRGVADFVRCGLLPQKVDQRIIDSLKQIDELKECRSQLPNKGDIVTLTQSEYKDLKAIYLEPDGERRSFLLVNILNKLVKVSVDNSSLDTDSPS
ncbi:transcription/translation regulatory transformer protein RfaH [Vibrio renipiscarius]|uniref:transcription/translation regulatory transformer protein RfaH n=1 Tax=Vibrio renipiscarius TaxID=1461322 RepID=UPI00354C8E73